MAKGYSIHIGLNNVDISKYKNVYPVLLCAENDARYYNKISNARGFEEPVKLIGQDATSLNLIEKLNYFSRILSSGDLLFITYSGHGTQVKENVVLTGNDTNDENDGYDEALVLYDRLFIDDEFKLCWSNFIEGVRIFFLTDSCYNGTVSEVFLTSKDKGSNIWNQLKNRGIEIKYAALHFNKNFEKYNRIKQLALSNTKDIQCSIIHIGSSQDDQSSKDGSNENENGYFTTIIKNVLDSNFKGSYKQLFETVLEKMPEYQKPNWDTSAGIINPEFENAEFLTY